MDVNQLLTELKGKHYRPVYLLHGEESYFIDLVVDFIEEHVLDEAQKGFDLTVLYGKDTDLVTVVNAARRYPMIASHQVIIVKEAQAMVWKEKEDETLTQYLSNPMPQTLLVLAYKHSKFDKRRKVYKAAQKAGVVFESSKVYEDRVAGWVSSFLKSSARAIDPRAAVLLADYLGTALSKVVNELEKLMLNVPEGREITVQDIEQHIGISKDFNVFELNTALAKRDSQKAFRIATYFAANPKNNPIQLTIGSLGSYFTKVLKYHYLSDRSQQAVAKALSVHPFFVREYEMAARNYGRSKLFGVINDLATYDMKSKGVGSGDTEPGDLLKELIFKILN